MSLIKSLLNLLIFFMCLYKVNGDVHKIDPTKYCTVSITIAIDFSIDMVNKNNIENLVDFILNNFTNTLPLQKTNVSISLMTYGANGITTSPYFNTHKSFENETLFRLNQLKSSQLGPSNLTEEDQSIVNAYNVSRAIKSMNSPLCLNGTSDFSCNKIVVIGINQTNADLFDLGNWIFLTSFDDYTLKTGDNNFEKRQETINNLVTISMNDLLMVICTQVINVDKFECGNGYCDESMCTGQENGCYNYLACIDEQCIYWDISVKSWSESKEICQRGGASLISIESASFQDDIYGCFENNEFWIGLNSIAPCTSSNWYWDQPNDKSIPLNKSGYTNWGQEFINGQPSCSCVGDSQSSKWQASDCNAIKLIACMKPATAYPTTGSKIELNNFVHSIWFIVIIIICLLILICIIVLGYLFIWPFIKRNLFNNIEEEQNHSTITNETSEAASTNLTHTDLESHDSQAIFDSDTSDKNLTPNWPNLESLLDETVDNPNQPTIDLSLFENIITFPQFDTPFDFNITDFIEQSVIEANPHHLVKSYMHKTSQKMFAVKYLTIPISRHEDEQAKTYLKKILREIESFRILWKDSNIVDLYGTCVHEGQVLLCMELMDLSLKNLYHKAHKVYGSFLEELVGYIVVKVVDAMIFCKSLGIMHRDIKPSNILVNYSGEIKLCDFGESRILENSLASTHVGTIAYWPPEFIIGYQNFANSDDTKYDIRSDIWSLGVTLMEIILGRLPYLSELQSESKAAKQDEQKAQLYTVVCCITTTNLNDIIEKEIRRIYSSDLCKFLGLCLQPLDKRPKLNELKTNIFYTVNNSIEKFDKAKIFLQKFNVNIDNAS